MNPTPEHRGLAPGIADVSEECANSTTGPGLQFGWDGEGLNANAVKLSAFAKKKALEFRGGAERALGRVLSDRLGRTELDDQGIPIMTRRVTEKSLILQFIAQEMARRVREGVRPVKEVPEAQILEGSTALRPLIEHAQKTLAGKAMLADSMIRRVEEKTGERETIKVNIRWQENDRGSLGKPYLYKALDINLETGGFVSSDEAIRRVNDFRVKPAASTATTIEQRARETLAKTKDQWVAQNPGLLFALAVTDMLRKDNLGPQPASK